MRYQLLTVILLSFVLSIMNDRTIAQSDSSKSRLKSMLHSGLEKLGKVALKDKWDSVKYYIRMMDSSSKNSYGEICLPHTLLSSQSPNAFGNHSNYKSAYFYLKSAIEFSSRINDTVQIDIVHKYYERVIFYFGMLNHFIGANTEAAKYLSKAAEMYRKKQETDRYVQCILVVAGIDAEQGAYGQAGLLNIKAQEMLEKIKKSPFEYYLLASSYNNQGIIYAETGNRAKALSSMKKANETERKAADFMGNEHIKMLLNLSEVYALNGYPDSALLQCSHAEEILPARKNSLYRAEILKEKALICMQQKKLLQALMLLKQYKKITDTLPFRLDTYDASLINLGTLYSKTNQLSAADSFFRKEIKKLGQSGLPYSYLMQQALLGLSSNLMQEKKYIEAIDSLISLCHFTFMAMRRNFYGMSETEKLKYKNGLDEIFNLMYVCLYHEKDISPELIAETCKLELRRNSLVLLNEVNLLNKFRNSSDTSLERLYNAWLGNKEILSSQYALPGDQRIFNTDSIETICETLEKKVSVKEYSNDANDYKAGFSSLLPDQQANTANIEFVRFHYAASNDKDSILYAAFIIKSADTIPEFVHLCSEKMLMKIMKNKNGDWIDMDQLTQKIYNSVSVASEEMYNMIWKPMELYLKNVENINYSTAGLLNNIAFHALYNGKNYLLHQFTFHRVFSLIDNQNSVYQKPQSVSVWGNMNYDSAAYYDTDLTQEQEEKPASQLLKPDHDIAKTAVSKNIATSILLPFDTTEISQLTKVFLDDSLNVNSYLNENATEENFKKQASSTTDVLHISTHGVYAPLDKKSSKASLPGSFISGIDNPLFRCWLAFSGANHYLLKGVAKDGHDNGILTGFEVAQLDLHNVQLLTLSACETGLGDVTDNEGNMGFQRAFKIAGVNNMLVSLWQVPAKQTAELLSLFYTFWLKGKTLSEALRDAETAMQKDNPSYYWAGFVLIE